MDFQLNTKCIIPNQLGFEKNAEPIPSKIGPYKVKKLLSKGGMSYLYLGIHNLQEIVIKVLSPKFSSNQEIHFRFLKEAEIIALANHPNVVRLLGQGKWENGLYIAMEFIRGTSLRQLIQKKELPHGQAIEILLQVSYALCHLHTHGVVHRDLKPENILINEQGDVKVIDFGIAEIESERVADEQKGVIGTPTYMSPEQRKNPNLASYASDIYSLGILAYELFSGSSNQKKIDLDKIPPSLQSVLEKAVQPEIEKRYPDIVDWITAFKAYCNEWKKKEASHPQSIQEWVTKVPPKSYAASFEIGDTIVEGAYLDFFELTQSSIVIVFACPVEKINFGFTPLIVGMVKMAIEFESFPFHPIPFIDQIRKAINKDPKIPNFKMAVLNFDLKQELFSFVSCGDLELCKQEKGAKEIFTTPNLPLGKNKQNAPGILGTVGKWKVGDEIKLEDDTGSLILKAKRI